MSSYERRLLNKAENQQKRLELYRQAHDLRNRGFSIRAIARKLNKGRGTIKRVLARQGERTDRSRHLIPFVPYLEARWHEGMVNRMQLYREIMAQGFGGSYGAVYTYFAARRAGLEKVLPSASQVNTPKQMTYSPSEGRHIFTRTSTELDAHDQARLQQLFSRLPEACVGYDLVRVFLDLFRKREPEAVSRFRRWLRKAQTTSVTELRRFAKRLRPDQAAIEAALVLPWSNGQVEGQITKLKLIKRAMYGRANFDLLRRRVLLA